MDVDSDHTQLRLRQSPPGHSQVERLQNRARLDARLLLQQPRRMDYRRSRGHPSTCLISATLAVLCPQWIGKFNHPVGDTEQVRACSTSENQLSRVFVEVDGRLRVAGRTSLPGSLAEFFINVSSARRIACLVRPWVPSKPD